MRVQVWADNGPQVHVVPDKLTRRIEITWPNAFQILTLAEASALAEQLTKAGKEIAEHDQLIAANSRSPQG